MNSSLFSRPMVRLLLFLLVLAAHPVYSQAQAVNASPKASVNPGVNRDAASTYVISPLDQLLIVVYAGDKQTGEYQKFVQSDGAVYLPYLEQDVKIGGIMLLDAEKIIEELSRKVIREPRVVITVISSFSQYVFTYGKITNSSVPLNTPLRVLQLIARVGGPQEGAIEDSIRVISADGAVRYFNYRKVNRNPSTDDNFLLKPGDIVFVPGANDYMVQVMGEVRIAGQYSMKNGDRVLDALLRAGSWNTTAEIKKVRLLRVSRGKNIIREVNLNGIFKNADSKQNYMLQNGDILFVPTKGQSKLQPLYIVISTLSVSLTALLVLRDLTK